METFKKRLSELFEEEKDRNHKCTRDKFAQQCGITVGQLSGYFQGNGETFCKLLGEIAARKKVSVAWLIGISDDRVGENVSLQDVLGRLSAQDLYVLNSFAEFMADKVKQDV